MQQISFHKTRIHNDPSTGSSLTCGALHQYHRTRCIHNVCIDWCRNGVPFTRVSSVTGSQTESHCILCRWIPYRVRNAGTRCTHLQRHCSTCHIYSLLSLVFHCRVCSVQEDTAVWWGGHKMMYARLSSTSLYVLYLRVNGKHVNEKQTRRAKLDSYFHHWDWNTCKYEHMAAWRKFTGLEITWNTWNAMLVKYKRKEFVYSFKDQV